MSFRQGGLYYFGSACIRCRLRGWRARVAPPREPTVYVCSHQNMQGPLTTLSLLPFPVRVWALHVFLDRRACYRQYADYTFSKRYGLPAPLARALAWCAAGFVSATVRSAGAIPVYRGSMKVGATFRESVAALKNGDSLIIFPDVDYAGEAGGIGEMYEGFLLLQRAYARAAGRPLRFVPLAVDPARRLVLEGEPLYFAEGADLRAEMRRVGEGLREQISRLLQDGESDQTAKNE